MIYVPNNEGFIWVDAIEPQDKTVTFIFELRVGDGGLDTVEWMVKNNELIFVADLATPRIDHNEAITLNRKDAEYLLYLLPKWVKEVPGPEHAWDPLWFGTLSREGDLKVHNEVKRILGL